MSMGWSNAVAYRQGFQIAQEQRNEILKIPFPPYMYGVSRVQIGKRQLGRGAGSVGAWAAQGSISYGVYPTDQALADGFKYSGGLADNWGWNGAPAGTVKFAKDFRIKTVSQVRSWEDARDALVHGYPVTVASNVGFTGPFVVRDGKKWGTARGQWGHQMCFIGCEDQPGHEKGCYIINSWGADAHPKPLNDEPPGGFWVNWQTVQSMVGQGDSWAYSDFDGFPADATANWNAFKQDKIEQAVDGNWEAELLARVEQPEVQPVLKEVRVMFSPSLLFVVLCLGLAAFVGALFWKYRSPRLTVVLLLAFTLIYGSANVDAGRRHRMQYYSQSACSCAAGVCANGQCALAGCVNGQCATAKCVNGQCSTGYVRPANKPYNPNAGLLPETKAPGIEVAAADATAGLKAFNAFRQPEPALPPVWNAMPVKTDGLRTYTDCWHNEKEFVLVVGERTDALMTLETADKPVAWVASHPKIKAGTYRVFMDAGRLAYTSLAKTPAVLQSAVKR